MPARHPADPNDPYPEPPSGDLPKPAYAADDYWRGHRQGRMMSRIDRCVCTFDEAGNGPIDVCEAHKAWMTERARKTMADAIPEIMQDVCEIDITGKWNRDDNPDRVVMTVQKLEAILRAHLVEPLDRN